MIKHEWIIQGTTPTHTVVLPIDTNLIKSVLFVYSQSEKEVFSKADADVTISARGVSTKLSQEDTFAFNPYEEVKLVVRIFLNTEEALATDPMYFYCRSSESKVVFE